MKKPKKTEKPTLITIRIVKLLAGFAAAALTLPTHAQVVAPPNIQAETALFLAMGQAGRNRPESFVVPVSDPARIAEIRQFLAERAQGTERRRLIPTCLVRLRRDGGNRNHSSPGAPEWGWEVAELVSVRRAQLELELYPAIPEVTANPSEIEGHLRGVVPGLPNGRISLIGYPIVMELKSENPRADLANISNRGLVGTGNDAKITGFVVEGGVPRNVFVRALGPSLAKFGVTGVLANPRLEVYQGTEKIAENDDWIDGPLNRPIVAIFPPPPPFHLVPADHREPAIELSLAPGAYTVIVTGVNGGTGVVLTEVFTF
jgi:hypothetical protein